jgi:hypothetical protein
VELLIVGIVGVMVFLAGLGHKWFISHQN